MFAIFILCASIATITAVPNHYDVKTAVVSSESKETPLAFPVPAEANLRPSISAFNVTKLVNETVVVNATKFNEDFAEIDNSTALKGNQQDIDQTKGLLFGFFAFTTERPSFNFTIHLHNNVIINSTVDENFNNN